MSVDELVDIIHSQATSDWPDRNASAFGNLFGGKGRYASTARNTVEKRTPKIGSEENIPYSALVHPSNPATGAYRGMSFAIAPSNDGPALVNLCVGTSGLGEDGAILGRPGHARKVSAICTWLNQKHGNGEVVAWAKQDPTRVDLPLPNEVKTTFSQHAKFFGKYDKVVYAMYRPTEDRKATTEAVAAFLDLFMAERYCEPLKSHSSHAATIQAEWKSFLMPHVDANHVADLLRTRRFVIIEGPPGTGKTRMADSLLKNEYAGNGRSIQFHPNTTYENFIGGLAPVSAGGEVGLRFQPTPGFLMQAAATAGENPTKKYLLHIDEINRADLGKVLGEAIYLLEANETVPRTIHLPYDFGPGFNRQLRIPENLHILGTMNSSDRSIAILDVAVRRRFGFVSLWPDPNPVLEKGCALTQKAFEKLVDIFVDHASNDTFAMVPGHSYFLESNPELAKQSLMTNLAPLLREYLAQGYVTGFAESIRSYLQWLEAQK